MKLSRASAYALHSLVRLAGGKADRVLPSHEIAEDDGMPGRFLLKVLKPLVSARILLSLKGPRGGYRLARTADKITLLDILEAVDGPLLGLAPEVGGGNKVDEQLRQVCDRSTEVVRQRLRKVTVQELAGNKG